MKNREYLRNGSLLLARSSMDYDGNTIVLAEYGNEYVTWIENHGSTHSGNYFPKTDMDSLFKATSDYYNRCKKYNLKPVAN